MHIHACIGASLVEKFGSDINGIEVHDFPNYVTCHCQMKRQSTCYFLVVAIYGEKI